MALPRVPAYMGMTTDLSHHFVEAVDQAAIASAAWRGKGDKNAADDAAVEAMRRTFDAVPFDGRVAIGEGERDEAPMLYIGEPLGSMIGQEGHRKLISLLTPWNARIIVRTIPQIQLQCSQQPPEEPCCTHLIATWTN